MTIPNDFEILGLSKNATLEDIQISFAYLYQMIDLIYPLGKNEITRKERSEEFHKLESAYLSALQSIRNEVITSSNSFHQKINEPISELGKIENILNRNKTELDLYSNPDCKYNNIYHQEFKTKSFGNRNYEKPTFTVNGKPHRIVKLSQTEICIEPLISIQYKDTIKGELHFSDTTKIHTVGKVIRKEQDKITIKLVTRIARRLLQQFKI